FLRCSAGLRDQPRSPPRRSSVLASAAQQQTHAAALAAHLRPGQAEDWQAADPAAGLPWVSAATQDLFIPHTLNLDLIDGVNFTRSEENTSELQLREKHARCLLLI